MTERMAPLDLLCTAPAVTDLLNQAIIDRDRLDTFLLTAGLSQLVEDRLHPDPLQLHRGAEFLDDGAGSHRAAALARTAARVLRPFAVGRDAGTLLRLRAVLGEASIRCGHAVLDPTVTDPALSSGFTAGLPSIRWLPSDILRVPTCFRSFDQHPDDVVELAHRLLKRTPDRTTPICVVGVRTSGSYLAPLCAAALELAGSTAVSVCTYRPGRPWRRVETVQLRAVVAAGGTIAVIDDPPVTGTALARTGRALERLGVPSRSIVFLLASADTESPSVIRRRHTITLPWSQWSVHQRLTEEAVGATLTELLGPGHTVVARHQPETHIHSRARVRERYAVEITTGSGTTHRDIAVEGAGLGYFGRHASAVATAVPGHVPHVYGLVDGLLYRDWISGVDRPGEIAAAEQIARYVVDRQRALQVDTDRATSMRGRRPAWEVASGLLSRQFGRLAPAGQTQIMDRVVRNLLRVDTASIPDGHTDARYWLRSERDGPLRKVDFHQFSFSNLEMTCYDAICDLAGAAADPPSALFESRLRQAYLAQTGEAVDQEKWLLYRLTQLWGLGRAGELSETDIEDRCAEAVHDYLSTVIALPRSTDGSPAAPICAIDLDGVLETDPLGFPCTTPAGALSLRALRVHGYRPVVVTGRSLPEAVARCRQFGLAGAVAEYGAVLYDQRTRQCVDLRDRTAAQAMRAVRRCLETSDGIEIDRRYRYGVRARSRRGPLPAELTRAIVTTTGPAVRVVVGAGQTDFVPSGIDKATGMRALSARLGGDLAFAVGDTAEDLPVFAAATLARAPRNADLRVRGAAIPLTRSSYQAGLAEACSSLLGHRPGSCPVCRLPDLQARTSLLCRVLALREDGMRGLAARTAALIATTAAHNRR
ncbi:HAD family hydrolase [Nocardia sp. NPDC056064]|uniref:HAD family hydrolase n=1 Tax=Nocardia sp. NPDC056064 TaxID=3345701 RepID=UPI0035DF1E11